MITRIPGNKTDCANAAHATDIVWDQIAGLLVPIIGLQGFRALYRRSLHITAADFPLLGSNQATLGESPSADLKLRLEHETPARAAEVNQALLVTFTRLLNDLIGESLTSRMLAPALRKGGPDNSAQEI